MIRKKLVNRIKQPRRGQVFILASLLLVVYAVSIIAILSEMSVINLNNQNEGDLNQAFSDLVFEIDKHNTIVMARVTQGLINPTKASNEISVFLIDYTSFLQNKGIFATINLLNTVINPDVTSTNSGVNKTDIIPSIELSIQFFLTSATSNEDLQFTTTIFTGYRAIHDGTYWHVKRVDGNLSDIEPVLGAEFYLGGIPTPPTSIFNGFYEVALNSLTEIRLPNGIYLYN
jgi:hypothetical protein